MTAHYIYYDGAYRVYVHDGRGHRTQVGPRSGWPTPRSAADYADLLDQRSPSPLRGSGDESPDGAVLPQTPPDADSSPDVPRGRRPDRRGR